MLYCLISHGPGWMVVARGGSCECTLGVLWLVVVRRGPYVAAVLAQTQLTKKKTNRRACVHRQAGTGVDPAGGPRRWHAQECSAARCMCVQRRASAGASPRGTLRQNHRLSCDVRRTPGARQAAGLCVAMGPKACTDALPVLQSLLQHCQSRLAGTGQSFVMGISWVPGCDLHRSPHQQS